MKKPFVVYLIVLISFNAKSQDTLSIGNKELLFNNQNAFSYNDTLTFNYEIDYFGTKENLQLKERANVKNSEGWEYNVEDSILVDTNKFTIDAGTPALRQSQVILSPSTFKNGNNTVVIWPDNIYENADSEDSIIFDINIIGESSKGYAKLSINNYQIINQTFIISNNSDVDQIILINNISGQIVSKFKLRSKSNKNIKLSKGIFSVFVIENSKRRTTKIMVK